METGAHHIGGREGRCFGWRDFTQTEGAYQIGGELRVRWENQGGVARGSIELTYIVCAYQIGCVLRVSGEGERDVLEVAGRLLIQ